MGPMQIQSIDKDDYFLKNAEFTTWLREHRSKFFNEMDSDETRALFGKIVLTGPDQSTSAPQRMCTAVPSSSQLSHGSFRFHVRQSSCWHTHAGWSGV